MGKAKENLLKALKSILSQDIILDKLKELLVKFVLKKLAIAVGFKAWLIATIVEEFFEEIAEPLIKVGLAEMKYQYYVQDGKTIIKRLEESEDNGDENSYDDAIDDIYS